MTDDEAAYLAWLDERCAETNRFTPDTRKRDSLDWCHVGLNTAYTAARHMFLHTVIREPADG